MHQIKPTRTDYVIAIIGSLPIVVVSCWLSEIATWANVAPKVIVAIGVVFTIALILTLTLLIKKDRKKYHVRSANRIVGLGLLVVGALYFFMREEIADLIGWSINIGDALMSGAWLFTSMWLLSAISIVGHGGEDNP